MKIFLIVILIPVIINTNVFAQKKNAVATVAGSVDYNIEKIYSNDKIIWSFEFINEKTIIFTEKKGKMYLLIDDQKLQNIDQR